MAPPSRQSSLFLIVILALMPSPGWSLTADVVEKLLREDTSFGHSIAVDGDTAVISALGDFEMPTGVAYVFTRTDDGWREQAKLFPEIKGSSYGTAVALEGDTAVITAPDSGSGGGSAYVFARSGSTWSLEARIFPDDSATGDGFGRSVAMDGGTILIGGFSSSEVPGAAYVFTRSAGVWSQQAKLVAPPVDDNTAFGISVDLDGNTALIGASTGPPTAPAGAAYVFTRAGTAWSQQEKLGVAVAEDGIGLGRAVALDNGTALIAAFRSAFLFTRSAGIWSQQAKLTPNDQYGFGGPRSVALESDVALIGAAETGTRDTGAAYLFRRDRGSWRQEAKLVDDAPQSRENFGHAIGLSGKTALIGAPGRSAAHVYLLGPDPRLHCPGDLNGDGLADLVAVTSQGDVIVKSLDASLVNRFSLDGTGERVDTELMADTNGNGAAELVALFEGPAFAEVRDLLTGGALGSVPFAPGLQALDLETIPDQTGNGIPELASLGQAPVKVEVRDALTGAAVNTIPFRDYVFPMDLEIQSDLNGNGWPELAVLGDNRRIDRADKIEIRDPATGAVVREIWLGKNWRVLQQERIADLNGNGSAEVAILRVHPEGNVNVMFRDVETRAWLGSAGFDVAYPPRQMLRLDDMNGNGSDEIVVFGWRLGIEGSNQKAKIRDSLTGQLVGAGRVFFDRNWPGRDVVTCADVNGNGAEELAMLGRRLSDGALKVIINDARTGERLAVVNL